MAHAVAFLVHFCSGESLFILNLGSIFINEQFQSLFDILQLMNAFNYLYRGRFGTQSSHVQLVVGSIYTQPYKKMVLNVSFYKPVELFSGTFNQFAAWWTAGDYCHCELVITTKPVEVMDVVKDIYQNAQKGVYPPDDCIRIISQIEIYFFDTAFRKHAQSTETLTLSFSQILGQRASVRVLKEKALDNWYKIPEESDNFGTLVPTTFDVSEAQQKDTLTFAIESLGKDYDTSGALCSWLPFASNARDKDCETYFCSEFVATAFQRIGFLDSLDAKRTTPNSLYSVLTL